MIRRALILLWLPVTACAMVEETGSLYGFMLDSCANCAYDNWLSHVSENIVRPDYNDYGPANLDPQTNDFGGFTYIPNTVAGDSTLARWRQVFQFAIEHEWESVDSMLAVYNAQWNYELAHLVDNSTGREHYVIRERIDSVFVDTNGDADPANDVIGGFHRAWGVYVFDPAPRHPYTIIQVPHPQDDYMAPPIATEIYMRDGLSILMIAGAGREVMWDSTQATYNNGLSFSDPSRNGRHPFQILTEVAKDHWDTPPTTPLVVIQLHSYDLDEHPALGDLQVSAYRYDTSPNMPLRDVGAHRDFVHALGRYPVQGVDGDATISTAINQYITLWSSPAYSFFGEDTVAIASINDYIGALENQQALYLHDPHDNVLDAENFIHIELDEYPDVLWQPHDFARWLPGTPPARLSNFRVMLEYYDSFINAVDSMLVWHVLPDTTAPLDVEITTVSAPQTSSVRVSWTPGAFDQHFDTYEIYYDTVAISATSPFVTRSSGATYTALGVQTTLSQRVGGLTAPFERYHFAVRARDAAGNMSQLSEEWGMVDSLLSDVTITIEGEMLHLFWSGEWTDNHYEVWEYPPNINEYVLLGTTADTTFEFVPSEYFGAGVYTIQVKRFFIR
jgi:hypothetical protein